MLIKKLLSAARTSGAAPSLPQPDYPLELEERLSALHGRANVRRHLDVLYGDVSIGGERFTDLYFRCLEDTGTAVTPFNVFQRFQTRNDLVRYFLETLNIPGARVECGAYRGATALLLCRTWRSVNAAFDGDQFFLIDSFSGTSTSTPPDFIPVRDASGQPSMQPFFPPGKTDVKATDVRGYFNEFPRACVLEGWIPDVFSQVPSTPWAFVHLDLTLYEATLRALEYFYPRLSPDGVLICDGSIFCPGAQKAVEDYSAAHDVPYVTLGHREAVFFKPSST
jgi:O-methyltransferase